jgi:outer membrane lipoprotein SlyB
MTDHQAHEQKEFSLTEPVSAPEGRGVPEKVKADTETLGETSGGFLGAVSGMSVGAIGGPVGLVIGGLAGALGGWWAGRGVADAITAYDDADLRKHDEDSPNHLADRGYDEVRASYAIGHLAGRNPEYAGRSFEEIEPELQRGWSDDVARQAGEWHAVRGFARAAFERARGARTTR